VLLVDSHAHLFYPDFNDDLDEVLARAVAANIGLFVVPGTNIETSRQAIALAERYPSVFASVGIHPLDIGESGEADFHTLEEFSKHPKVVAIGEIGLDYYYDKSPRATQQKVYRKQIEIAVRRNRRPHERLDGRCNCHR